MSAIVYELKQSLNTPPFNQPFEKNYEQIYIALSLLSRRLTEKFSFEINVEPIIRKGENGGFGGYIADCDLFGFYSRAFKNRFEGRPTEELMEKHFILAERTGRNWEELSSSMEGLSQTFSNLWFIKDALDTPYSQSDLNENITVLKSIPGKEIRDVINNEIVLEQYLFRFTLGGLITIDSTYFGNILTYAPEALDEIVHRIFNKLHVVKSRESYIIPNFCPPEVRRNLEDAINCYVTSNNGPSVVMARSAFEQLLTMKFREKTGKDTMEDFVCPECKYNLGQKPMNVVKLYKWAISEGFVPRMYEEIGYVISKIGAGGAHSTADIKSYDADLAIRLVLILLQNMKS